MENNLARLQKQLAGDGPAEKQVLLLKLLHEFETAPHFGERYLADADSAPQKWIARIGALLARAGLQHKIAFASTRHTSVQFWSGIREPFRQLLLAAAEEIKLELELDGHEDIGQVYGSQRQYDFLRDLKEIILGAQNEVFVVDPYFDGQSFETYLGPLGDSCSIRLLCRKYSSDVAGHVAAFKAQHGVNLELRKSGDLHDRLVIIDRSDCWLVGGSIKDAGTKPTYLVPLQPSISPTKVCIYEDLWQQATPI
ncbi:hypothetical protein [Pelagibacterium halotolerans]|uniref:PLD phosphodiesterase domain-containing protein n=1 Tax=Pelagibacterium halotolerans (strain DSM 22347 / JCM 15775 / CGMCC 1.7692 / B2) TaxID=1082931 RepID=G4RGM4_PELHB|nr:hypothetical protein [Pelagibacterium halotolerans]AEQ51083.1 hypothetical protein KKY_1048 [Pelagibacterium halotolerans B2]QJR19034.1 hypothetical protein HKM20_11650 [Pelagibacterium halotolerans]SEA04267.1 hypothetical protein SAMN05428936_101973 [Pelagibacterium halotolerans]